MKEIRIALVDTDATTIKTLEEQINNISSASVHCILAPNLSNLYELESKYINVVIIDADLTNYAGIEAMQKINALYYPYVKIIAVAENISLDLVRMIVETGALGLISKKEIAASLGSVMQSVMCNRIFIEPF